MGMISRPFASVFFDLFSGFKKFFLNFRLPQTLLKTVWTLVLVPFCFSGAPPSLPTDGYSEFKINPIRKFRHGTCRCVHLLLLR